MSSQRNSANDFSLIQSKSSRTANTIEEGSDKNGIITIDINDDRQNRVLTPKEISKTFRIMAYRKSERQVRGRYRRRSYTRVFWFIMFMLVFLSLVGAGIGGLLSKLIKK
jgi:hypothetical protein